MIRHLAGARRPPEGPYDADVVILALDRLEETVDAIRSALSQTGVIRHVTVPTAIWVSRRGAIRRPRSGTAG